MSCTVLYDRRRILIWISGWVSLLMIFELTTQYNWRSFIPSLEPRVLTRILEEQEASLPLQILTWETSIHSFEFEGFRSLVLPQSSPDTSDNEAASLHNACCGGVSGRCETWLSDFSKKHASELKFWLFHDPLCQGTFMYDNVGFSGSSSPDFLSAWRNVKNLEFRGVFETAPPLSFIRFLLVQSSELSDQIEWRAEDLSRIQEVLDSIVESTETVLETQLVYSGQSSAIAEALRLSDPFDRSRILNEELAIWKGSPHLLEFGSNVMPPLRHIAVLSSNSLDEGVYEITDFGHLIVKRPADLMDCEVKKGVCLIRSEALVEIVMSVVRGWLGLRSDACTFESACSSGFSNSERIAISSVFRRKYLQSIVSDLQKQMSLLSALPRLRFGQAVSELMSDAIQLASESLMMSEGEELHIATEKAKQGSFKAAEALAHDSVVSKPYFSWEFRLALYGPIALPVALPLLASWILIFRNRRRQKED